MLLLSLPVGKFYRVISHWCHTGSTYEAFLGAAHFEYCDLYGKCFVAFRKCMHVTKQELTVFTYIDIRQ